MGEPRDKTYIDGGRRCAVRKSEWMDDWWVGTSPRNGDGASVEGPWEDWVTLARAILELDATPTEEPRSYTFDTKGDDGHTSALGIKPRPTPTEEPEQ